MNYLFFLANQFNFIHSLWFYFLCMILCGFHFLACMQTSHNNQDQPCSFVLRRQEFYKRWQDKNGLKIKQRRLKLKRCPKSKLGTSWTLVNGKLEKCKPVKDRVKRSILKNLIKVQDQKVTPRIIPLMRQSIETTLIAEQLRWIIEDDVIRIALEEQQSPEYIRSEINRVIDEKNFLVGQRAPFIVPHCYHYLARLMQQAKRLKLSDEERNQLRIILIRSQLAHEQLEEIELAFQCIEKGQYLPSTLMLWVETNLNLAVNKDGKCLEDIIEQMSFMFGENADQEITGIVHANKEMIKTLQEAVRARSVVID